MTKTLTWIAAALIVVPAMLWGVAEGASAAEPEATLTVLSPQGAVPKKLDLAPRLDTLEGKTVAMWLSATADQVYAGKGAELYDILEKKLKDTYPGIRIVSYSELPMKFMPEQEVVDAIIKAKPDAVVAGFGG